MAGRSGLMRFAALDHGAILRLQGKPTAAIRFLIGHPLTASRMTKLQIGSGLYAPLSLLVAADERTGQCWSTTGPRRSSSNSRIRALRRLPESSTRSSPRSSTV